MDFAQFRRKINDSDLGQKVNGSIPGILVEGTSRGVRDSINKLGEYVIIGALVYKSARHFSKGRNFQGVAYLGLALIASTASGIERDKDPNTHYSHTSKLYKKEKDARGIEVMVKVPLRDALIGKIAEYSPSTALALAVDTSEAPYRV